MTADPRLSLRDVRKSYGDARDREQLLALDGISLDVAAREFLVIVGPSGCGKGRAVADRSGVGVTAVPFPFQIRRAGVLEPKAFCRGAVLRGHFGTAAQYRAWSK